MGRRPSHHSGWAPNAPALPVLWGKAKETAMNLAHAFHEGAGPGLRSEGAGLIVHLGDGM